MGWNFGGATLTLDEHKMGCLFITCLRVYTSLFQQSSKLVRPIRALALVGKTFVCKLVVRRRRVSFRTVKNRTRALRYPYP